MYRHIVVALDGSNNADTALIHAAEICRLAGAKLILAHIINPVDMAIDFPQLVYQAAYTDMAEKRAAGASLSPDTVHCGSVPVDAACDSGGLLPFHATGNLARGIWYSGAFGRGADYPP